MLNARLKTRREMLGMTQAEVARRVHVGSDSYNKYERAKAQPSNETLLLLANVLETSVDYLLGRTGQLNSSARDRHTHEIKGNAIRIPVLGVIPAGVPLEAIEEVLDYEEVPIEWGRGGAEYFALKIQGESMFPKYLDGDVVIFQKAVDCDNGNECAVIVNGYDGTFKKVIKQKNGIVLQPLNPNGFEPVFLSNDDIMSLPVRIVGIAKEIRRKVSQSTNSSNESKPLSTRRVFRAASSKMGKVGGYTEMPEEILDKLKAAPGIDEI